MNLPMPQAPRCHSFRGRARRSEAWRQREGAIRGGLAAQDDGWHDKKCCPGPREVGRTEWEKRTGEPADAVRHLVAVDPDAGRGIGRHGGSVERSSEVALLLGMTVGTMKKAKAEVFSHVTLGVRPSSCIRFQLF